MYIVLEEWLDGRYAMLRRTLTVLFPALLVTFGTQAQAYTLNEAVAHTLATSPDMLIVTNTRDEVDKQLGQAYADYLPRLDMTAAFGEQYSNNTVTRGNVITPTGPNSGTRTMTRTDFSMIASQILFDGFAVYHNVEGKKYRVVAESWRVNSKAQNVALEVLDAYLNVLLNREKVSIARNNVAVHERLFGQISKRSESGIGRKADMDQAQARVALAKTNLLVFEHNLNDAETTFLRRVGIQVPAVLSPVELPATMPKHEREAIDIGLRQHPELLASIEDVNVTREEFKGAKAPFSPRFTLELTNTRNHNPDGSFGDSDENSAMVRMTWNLFNGGKDLAKLCETAYKMQEAQEVSNRSQRQLVEAVRFSWAIYDYNQLELVTKQLHVDATARTFEAYQKQFNIGQRTLLDLLNSQNELFNSQTAYVESKYDVVRGAYRLFNSMGTLTQYMKVELPRQAEPRPTAVLANAMRFFDRSSTLFDG